MKNCCCCLSFVTSSKAEYLQHLPAGYLGNDEGQVSGTRGECRKNCGKGQEVGYGYADERHELSHCLLRFERENGQLGVFSSSRELFAGHCPKKNGCRTIGVFPPWNTRLPLRLRERWEQKGTEHICATAVSWLPSAGLRQDLAL